MFFRFLGRIFFLFYILPFIVDVARNVRKHAEPELIEIYAQGMEKTSKHFVDLAKEHPIPARSA